MDIYEDTRQNAFNQTCLEVNRCACLYALLAHPMHKFGSPPACRLCTVEFILGTIPLCGLRLGRPSSLPMPKARTTLIRRAAVHGGPS